MKSATHSRVIGNKSFHMDFFTTGMVTVYWRHINPNTNQPWQRLIDVQTYDSGFKALAAYHKMIREKTSYDD